MSGTSEILDTRGAAAFLRLSASWLTKARLRGDGPRYIRHDQVRRVLYRRSDLENWLAEGDRRHTSETRPAA